MAPVLLPADSPFSDQNCSLSNPLDIAGMPRRATRKLNCRVDRSIELQWQWCVFYLPMDIRLCPSTPVPALSGMTGAFLCHRGVIQGSAWAMPIFKPP
jgi:hypothetical protein